MRTEFLETTQARRQLGVTLNAKITSTVNLEFYPQQNHQRQQMGEPDGKETKSKVWSLLSSDVVLRPHKDVWSPEFLQSCMMLLGPKR